MSSKTKVNGRRWSVYAEELEDIIRFEEGEIQAGRIENAVLLEGIAGSINIGQFLTIARFRGKQWRFLSALSDKALQIQGYALLDFMADAIGRDLATQVFTKATLNYQHLKGIKAQMDARFGANDFTERIFADMEDDLVEMTRDTRQRYLNRIKKLLE